MTRNPQHMNEKRRWFKIWAVGNGGMACFARHVYWYDYSNDPDEMANKIEREIGPLSGGIRSLHWRKVKPPRKVVEARIYSIENECKYLLSELKRTSPITRHQKAKRLMFKSQFKTRDKSAFDEATASPIFLFQRRRWIYTGVPDGYEYIFDHGVVQLDDDNKPVRDEHGEYKVLTDEELSEMIHGEFDLPCAIETWETDRVFLTRQEGEEYGKARAYNYRDGWRVYSVNCHGELAQALRDGSEFDAKRVDNPSI